MVPRNRPRITGDRAEEVLDATLDLLIEVGYHRLTLDAVARRARASKATLYRRWESKSSLVIEAVIHAKDVGDIDPPNTGSLRGDLLATFCGSRGPLTSRTTEIMGAVITATRTDEEFALMFREHYLTPKIERTKVIYHNAIKRGEISPTIDLEVIGPALAGVLLHREYLLGEPITNEIVARIIDHLIIPAVTHSPHPPLAR